MVERKLNIKNGLSELNRLDLNWTCRRLNYLEMLLATLASEWDNKSADW